MRTHLFDLPTRFNADDASLADPPSRDAPYEDRAEWSMRYVAWYLDKIGPLRALPSDVRPTHLYEVEFADCMLDPPEYFRETQQELTLRKTVH